MPRFRTQARAVFLALLMVLSVFAGTITFAGTAVAASNLSTGSPAATPSTVNSSETVSNQNLNFTVNTSSTGNHTVSVRLNDSDVSSLGSATAGTNASSVSGVSLVDGGDGDNVNDTYMFNVSVNTAGVVAFNVTFDVTYADASDKDLDVTVTYDNKSGGTATGTFAPVTINDVTPPTALVNQTEVPSTPISGTVDLTAYFDVSNLEGGSTTFLINTTGGSNFTAVSNPTSFDTTTINDTSSLRVRVNATDDDGNSALNTTGTITVDNTPPAVSVDSPTTTKLRRTDETLGVTVTVDEANIDGNAVVNLTAGNTTVTYSVPVSNGTNTFDLLLNSSTSATSSTAHTAVKSTGNFTSGTVYNLSVNVDDDDHSTTATQPEVVVIDDDTPDNFTLVSPDAPQEFENFDGDGESTVDDLTIAYAYTENNTGSVVVTLNNSVNSASVTVNESQYVDDGNLKSFKLDLTESFSGSDVSLSDGAYNVTIQVTDEAGNSIVRTTDKPLVYINQYDVRPSFNTYSASLSSSGMTVTVNATYNVSVPEDVGDLDGDSLVETEFSFSDQIEVHFYDESDNSYDTRYVSANRLVSNTSVTEDTTVTETFRLNISSNVSSAIGSEDRVVYVDYDAYNEEITAYDSDGSSTTQTPYLGSTRVVDNGYKRPTIEFVEVDGVDTSDRLLIHFSRPVTSSDGIQASDFVYQSMNNSTGATVITDVIDVRDGGTTVVVELDREVAVDDVGNDLVSVKENALYNWQSGKYVSPSDTAALEESDPPTMYEAKVTDNASKVVVWFDQPVVAGDGGDLAAANFTYVDANGAGASSVVSANQTNPWRVVLTLDSPATSDDVDKDSVSVASGEVFDRFGNTQFSNASLGETVAPDGLEVVEPDNRTVIESDDTLQFAYRYTENIPNGTSFVTVTLKNDQGDTYTYYINDSQYVNDGVVKTVTLDLNEPAVRDDGRFSTSDLVDEQYSITLTATDTQGNSRSVTTNERLVINDEGPVVQNVDATPENDLTPGQQVNVSFQVKDAANITGATIHIVDESGQPVNSTPVNLSIPSENLQNKSDEKLKADIVFLIDDSGSMGDEITTVKNSIKDFANEISDEGEVRFAVVTFADGLNVVQPFTSDPADVENALANIGTSGGYEQNYDAIEGTLDGSLLGKTAGSNTVIIDITDEPDSETGSNEFTRQDNLASAMSSQGVKYIAVSPDLSGGDQKKTLAEKTTDAAWFDIQDFNSSLLLGEIAAETTQRTMTTVTRTITLPASLEDNSDYTVVVEAEDESGHTGYDTAYRELDINSEQPVISHVEANANDSVVTLHFNEVVVPVDGQVDATDFSYQDVSPNGSTAVVEVLEFDGDSATLRLDNPVQAADLDSDLVGVSEGAFVDTDGGNARIIDASQAVAVDDTTPPEVDVESDSDPVINASNDEQYTVHVTGHPVSEPITEYTVTISDGNTTVMKNSTSDVITLNVSTLADGSVNVTAEATDAGGNTGSETVVVEKDTVAPTLVEADADATTDAFWLIFDESLESLDPSQIQFSTDTLSAVEADFGFKSSQRWYYWVRLNRSVEPSEIGSVTVNTTATDEAGNPATGTVALTDDTGPAVEFARAEIGSKTVLVELHENVSDPMNVTASDFLYNDTNGAGAGNVTSVSMIDNRTFNVTLDSAVTAGDLAAPADTIAVNDTVNDTVANPANPAHEQPLTSADQEVPDLETTVSTNTITVRLVTASNLSTALSGDVVIEERNVELASAEGFTLEDRFVATLGASDFTEVKPGVYEATVTVSDDGVYDVNATLDSEAFDDSVVIDTESPHPTEAVILSVTSAAQLDETRNTTRIRVLFNEPIDAEHVSPSDVSIENFSGKVVEVQNAGPFGAVEILVEGKVQTGTSPNVTIAAGSYWDLNGTTGATGSKTVVHTDILHLEKGINFVSVPAASGSLPISDLPTSKIEAVFRYNTTTGTFDSYVPGAPGNEFDTLVGGEGYIVRMDANATVPINVANVPTGRSPPNAQRLREGYNLVGHYQEDRQSVSIALSSVTAGESGDLTDTVFHVLRQTEGSTTFEYESYRANDFKTFERGEAYWVFVTSDQTYTEAPMDGPRPTA